MMHFQNLKWINIYMMNKDVGSDKWNLSLIASVEKTFQVVQEGSLRRVSKYRVTSVVPYTQ